MSNNAKIIKSEDGKLFLYTPEYDTVKERIEARWFSGDKLVRFISVMEFSNDFINDLAKICAASIMSDEVHQDEETYIAIEICKEMNIRWRDFKGLLDEEINKTTGSNYKNVKEYLLDSQLGSQTKNGMLLLEAALHIILADGIMADKEAQLIADIAEILSIPFSKVIGRLSQFIRFEKEVLVDITL